MSRNTVLETYRLRLEEDDWNLRGKGSTSSRTRNGGSGRPQLCKGVYNESSSSSDSDYQADEETSSSSESDADEQEDEEEQLKKPPPPWLFLEFESLKKCMEKNCRCPKCNGPVKMSVKMLCLASNVMVSCADKDCGYVDVSDLPATAKVGAKVNVDDHERSTDFAINVLFVKDF
jgi:hypothetical protein